jgi:hypothetical protein
MPALTQNLLDGLKRVLAQPAFVVVAMILLVAAVGINGTTQYLKLHFKKLPVPMARPLTQIAERAGPWVQVSLDEPFAHDFEEVLGTKQYCFRDYVDSRLVSRDELAAFKDKTNSQRRDLAARIRETRPQAVVNLGVTYYTGMVDTVAHVPDRCYVADGYEPTTYQTPRWDVLKDRPGDKMVRFIVFEDQTPGRRSVSRNVAYFFHSNGEYTNDPVEVRKSLANLRQRYGYYMKVEVQTLALPADQSQRVMNEFLTWILPEIEKSLPDWQTLMSESSGAAGG